MTLPEKLPWMCEKGIAAFQSAIRGAGDSYQSVKDAFGYTLSTREVDHCRWLVTVCTHWPRMGEVKREWKYEIIAVFDEQEYAKAVYSLVGSFVHTEVGLLEIKPGETAEMAMDRQLFGLRFQRMPSRNPQSRLAEHATPH